MSSIEPNDFGGEVNGSKKVRCGLLASNDDGANLLEFGEEVFDLVAAPGEIAVVLLGVPAICLGRDDGGLAGGSQRNDDTLIGVKGLLLVAGFRLCRSRENVNGKLRTLSRLVGVMIS